MGVQIPTRTRHPARGEPIEQPYLAFLGSMTPASIRRYAGAGSELWHDGFLARFAFAAAPPHDFKHQTFASGDLPLPGELQQQLHAWHQRLGVPDSEIEPETNEQGRPTGRYTMVRGPLPEQACIMAREAYQAYNTYRLALRQMLATSRHEDLDGSYGRLPEIGLRIAVLVASMEHHNRIELPTGPKHKS